MIKTAMKAETEVRRPTVLEKYTGRTVLCVGAHPDDLELGIGGTLALLSECGARVVMAVVSIPNNLEARREEAARAAQLLGGEVRFCMPDRLSRVEDLKNHQLVTMMDALVREYEPDAMFTHSLANLHVDHKLVYEACMSSQRLRYFDIFCYPPTSCYPVGIPFYPHVYIDISRTIDLKMKAIQIHSSQFDRRGLKTEHYRRTCGRVGEMIGADYAEGLEIVRMRFN